MPRKSGYFRIKSCKISTYYHQHNIHSWFTLAPAASSVFQRLIEKDGLSISQAQSKRRSDTFHIASALVLIKQTDSIDHVNFPLGLQESVTVFLAASTTIP